MRNHLELAGLVSKAFLKFGGLRRFAWTRPDSLGVRIYGMRMYGVKMRRVTASCTYTYCDIGLF